MDHHIISSSATNRFRKEHLFFVLSLSLSLHLSVVRCSLAKIIQSCSCVVRSADSFLSRKGRAATPSTEFLRPLHGCSARGPLCRRRACAVSLESRCSCAAHGSLASRASCKSAYQVEYIMTATTYCSMTQFGTWPSRRGCREPRRRCGVTHTLVLSSFMGMLSGSHRATSDSGTTITVHPARVETIHVPTTNKCQTSAENTSMCGCPVACVTMANNGGMSTSRSCGLVSCTNRQRNHRSCIMCLECAPSERDRRPPPHEMTVPSSILQIGLQCSTVTSALAPKYMNWPFGCPQRQNLSCWKADAHKSPHLHMVQTTPLLLNCSRCSRTWAPSSRLGARSPAVTQPTVSLDTDGSRAPPTA